MNGGTLRIASTTQSSLLHDDLNLASGTTFNSSAAVTVQGNLEWSAATIMGAGQTTIASAGTLNAAARDHSTRTLNTGTLRIEGTATLAGNSNNTYFYTYLQNGAKIDDRLGGTLDLQDDQTIIDNGTSGPENLVHVESGGTLSRSTGSTPAYVTTPAILMHGQCRRWEDAQPPRRQRHDDLDRAVQRRDGRRDRLHPRHPCQQRRDVHR